MAQPVHKLFLFRHTSDWYALTQEKKDELLRKDAEALAKVGGKAVILCNSGWSSEQWMWFGIEEFPSIEALQKHTELLAELNWFRYVDTMTLLGTLVAPAQ